MHELSGSKFHSVTSSHVILYNDVKNLISSKVDLSGFGNYELLNFQLYDWYMNVYPRCFHF